MDTAEIRLTAPAVAWHDSWLAAAQEFAADGYQHGSGLLPDDAEPRPGVPAWRPAELRAPATFAGYVAYLNSLTDRTVAARYGMVPDSHFWIVEGDQFLGSVSLRHDLNDFLLEVGGNIGYSVRPSARRRGVATAALRLTLEQASRLGLTRVLLTCDVANVASYRTIENCGGVLEDVRGDKRRYWIELS